MCAFERQRDTERYPTCGFSLQNPQSHGWVRPKSGSPKLLQVSLVTGIHPSGAIPEVSQAIHEQKAKIRREGGTQTQPPPIWAAGIPSSTLTNELNACPQPLTSLQSLKQSQHLARSSEHGLAQVFLSVIWFPVSEPMRIIRVAHGHTFEKH